MPCTNDGAEWENYETNKKTHEILTRLACDHCKEMESKGEVIPDWATTWWANHKIADEQRKKENEKAKKSAAIRAAALAKLDAHERDELGL